MNKTRYLVLFIVTSLFLFFAAGSIDLDEFDDEFEAALQEAAEEELAAGAVESDREPANIGEAVDMGDSVWTVLAVEDRGSELESPNEYIDSRETEGTHVWVKVKVENNSNDQQRLFETPTIRDADGRNFSQVDTQTIYLEEGVDTMIAEPIPAGMSKEFEAIYEVAPGAEDLQFMARDFAIMDTSYAPIDLDL